MKFFAWFAVATIAFLLLARFKPQAPAEPIIPTEAKEAQGHPGEENAPPARTEEQGERDAQKGGSTYFVVPGHALSNAA
ncbi:hypothetical protein GCM10023172_34900 [Hymenobacter ginsengisoli]|uniref:Uncharacterized protein n=1 Tax=Hymenobacter ginsengisoli TaxID=1051626 RepID=A0ABP8QQ49_9BACT|nr:MULTISPECIES: hypothetical protein [unclassified Hymenobacter]MBO2033071.1 hypothetical protein [Hymenobacter sp. BT559]